MVCGAWFLLFNAFYPVGLVVFVCSYIHLLLLPTAIVWFILSAVQCFFVFPLCIFCLRLINYFIIIYCWQSSPRLAASRLFICYLIFGGSGRIRTSNYLIHCKLVLDNHSCWDNLQVPRDDGQDQEEMMRHLTEDRRRQHELYAAKRAESEKCCKAKTARNSGLTTWLHS